MTFYDNQENVEQYVAMAQGYDGQELVALLREHLAAGASVLELGMGPGVDLDLLRTNYSVIGSDRSTIFLERYRRTHPEATLLQLDAVTLATTMQVDAIYSNKVLHHLTVAELQRSFARQAEILHDGGLALHSFWYGTQEEEHERLLFIYHTEESLQPLLADHFDVLVSHQYTEMDEGDSLVLLLRKKEPPAA